MNTLPAPEIDRELLQRMYDGYTEGVRAKLGRLSERTLFQTRPRDDLFLAAAYATGLGKVEEGRLMLGALARLSSASLELGSSANVKTVELGWPPGQGALTLRGPADPVTAPEWVRSLSAALVARDAVAEAALRVATPAASSTALSWNPYWDAWVEAWKQALDGHAGPAGAALATALDRADPEHAYDEEDAQYMLGVIAPAIEVMYRALARDAAGCDQAIGKGLERVAHLYRSTPDQELRYLPIQLLGAVRLAERLGVARNVDSPVLAILDPMVTSAPSP
ncbi:MAG: Imm49 family immunity protein [Myxococcaceae bacterium]